MCEFYGCSSPSVAGSDPSPEGAQLREIGVVKPLVARARWRAPRRARYQRGDEFEAHSLVAPLEGYLSERTAQARADSLRTSRE